MEHDPLSWGRPRDDIYGGYNHQIANAGCYSDKQAMDKYPKMVTQQPIITGTSVVALKFKDGIMMAADNMGSYGSLMRFRDVERLIRVGKETIVGISGDISDMQQIEKILEELETNEEIYDNDEGHNLRAPHVHAYLSKVMYNRRSQMNPYWNAMVVGGYDDERNPFLRYVDLQGVTFGSSSISTGFGSYLATPLLRKLIPNDPEYVNITVEQARKAIADCMRVLFYRDARSLDLYSLVTIKKDEGLKFEKNVRCEGQSWSFAQNIRGYGPDQL